MSTCSTDGCNPQMFGTPYVKCSECHVLRPPDRLVDGKCKPEDESFCTAAMKIRFYLEIKESQDLREVPANEADPR